MTGAGGGGCEGSTRLGDGVAAGFGLTGAAGAALGVSEVTVRSGSTAGGTDDVGATTSSGTGWTVGLGATVVETALGVRLAAGRPASS